MIAVLAGLLLAVASSPYNWWPVAVIGLAVAYRRLEDRTWKQRASVLFISFWLLFLIGLSWSRQFNVPGFVLLSAAEALFFVVVAVVPADRGWRRAVGFPAALALAELARIYFPFGGLPMGGITTGQASGPLAPAAAVIGEVGLVFLLGLAAVAVVELVRVRHAFRRLGLIAIVPVIALPLAGASIALPPTGQLRVATVQGGGVQALSRAQQDERAVFQRHLGATRQVQDPVDLIVWPEDVVAPGGPIAGTPEASALSSVAQLHRATVIAGVVEDEGERFRNAAISWNLDGVITGRYEKVHRVPFGEYVPYRSSIDRIADLSEVPTDAIPGTGPGVLSVGPHKVGVSISFEGLFSRRARSSVRDGGELLVIPTNASSYKSSKVAATQVQSARLRAWETKRWVVQSSPTGRSAIIDDRGRVQAVSTIGPEAILQAETTLHSGRTPYVRWGDLPLLVICLIALVVSSVKWGRRDGSLEYS